MIGRAFLYNILKRITELDDRVDRGLNTLERLDFIRTRSLQPELEYMFKHPLTQEVVYNGLLRKERQEIHEQIALVMEQLFQERLPEFYETLAFHFKRGRSIRKAVNYLVKSGEKSLNRYAVEESHQYFKEAFDILSAKPNKTKEEKLLLIDILLKWAYVFFFRGFFRELVDLLNANEEFAESLDDKARLGIFYHWLGLALWGIERYRGSYQYLHKALYLGEEINDHQVIGYASSWLAWTCAELGLLDEAIAFGKRGIEIFMPNRLDDFMYFSSLGGMGYAYFNRGDINKGLETGRALLDHGQKYSNIRSLVYSQFVMGLAYFAAGDLSSAIECFQSAIRVSADPYFSQFLRYL